MYDESRTFGDVIGDLCVSGKVTLLALTGQAGAGKTNHIAPLIVAEAEKRGHHSCRLGLDVFFRLSSRDRATWIAEGDKKSSAESLRRRDQINWWDFGKAQTCLNIIRQGKPLRLEEVYNREDGGELTRTEEVIPPDEGMLLVFDGVAVCHLEGFDEVMYVHAPAEIRLERLRERDVHRKGEQILERFGITQEFECHYFPEYWDAITSFVDNSVDNPRVMQQMSHVTALNRGFVPEKSTL
ncbi:MAG: hypothetical protein CMI53_03945 [Parcubacteria group bacterium]|jgi:uridine kinase|nr:hypothetical protein [Parcubacteria group bacterium]|tara:strand:+ start:3222 stop:3941 length:720 start_codon:yes stop_codon:yes gene_type:complete